MKLTAFRSPLRAALFLGALVGAMVVRFQVSRWAETRLSEAIAAATAQDPVREALEHRVVIVDAGHGGQDGGTSGNGVQEKDATLDIARRVERQLRQRGIEVRMTREHDRYVELEERCAKIPQSNAAAFVSIHLNAATVRGVSGIETYFCSQRSRLQPAGDLPAMEDCRSEYLADLIQRRSCRATSATDRGVRDSHLYVVQHAACPAVLVECGYLTHAEEARRLKRDEYKEKLAVAIADGIRQYLIATSFNPRRGFSQAAAGQDVAADGP
jgi:N-acetylmuramoyl-L-alanine amidase